MDTAKPAGADYDFYNDIPLGNGQYAIRLLSLMPGVIGSPIECTLEQANLDDKPNFEALSYNWGADDELKRITVASKPLYVTPNLESALQHLRHTDMPRRLWIDKICINQASNTERGAQVSIMKPIYSSAHTTIAWLGDDIKGNKAIKNFFNANCELETIEKAQQLSTPMQKPSSNWFRRKYDSVVQRGASEYMSAWIQQLRKTLHSPYFSRAWVLQELAVSQNVILQCGSTTAQLDTFVRVFRLSSSSRGAVDYFAEREHDNSWYERGLVLGFLHEQDFTTSTLSLSSCLARFRSFQVGRPVDKLYALYGLAAKDVERLGLYPDYNIAVEQLYIDVAWANLDTLGDMAILEMPRGMSELRKNLPSWVPDWYDFQRLGAGLTPESQALRKPFFSGAESRPPLTSVASEDSHGNRKITVQRFHASRTSGTADKPTFAKGDKNELHISAMVFDSVAEQSEEFTKLLEEAIDEFSMDPRKFKSMMLHGVETLEEAIKSWDELAKWKHRVRSRSSTTYVGGGRPDHAFLRTLCADSVPLHVPFERLEDLEGPCDQFVQALIGKEKWYDIGRKMMPGASEEVKHSAGLSAQLNAVFNNLGYRDFMRLLDTIGPTYRRRFAITSKGYFCLVPAETKINDSIIIVKGGFIPLVVRAEGKSHTLVGESYVHGIMNGEAWDQARCVPFVLG